MTLHETIGVAGSRARDVLLGTSQLKTRLSASSIEDARGSAGVDLTLHLLQLLLEQLNFLPLLLDDGR